MLSLFLVLALLLAFACSLAIFAGGAMFIRSAILAEMSEITGVATLATFVPVEMVALGVLLISLVSVTLPIVI